MGNIWLCTRESVRMAVDAQDSPRVNAQIDRACAKGTEAVQDLCHRTFIPTLRTISLPWPSLTNRGGHRIWLDDNEIISLTTMTAGGVVIASADRFLESDAYGPPYDSVEIDRDSAATLGGGTTSQRSIVLTGLFGYRDDSVPAGTLAANVLIGASTIDVSDSAALGVGDVLTIGSERLSVDEKAMVDTGQNTAGALTASTSSVSLPVGSGTAFAVGETILVDSERMLITDIAGNTLIVKRAVDGTVLASHLTATDVYAPRRLTVTRAALGTTAAAHLSAATIRRYDPPASVRSLAVQEAIHQLQQEASGMARTIGAGDSLRNASLSGIRDLRTQVYNSHGRKARHRASS